MQQQAARLTTQIVTMMSTGSTQNAILVELGRRSTNVRMSRKISRHTSAAAMGDRNQLMTICSSSSSSSVSGGQAAAAPQ
jgi:hypothetical protein